VTAMHRMPFGAEVRDDGVRFRLWAPAAPAVRLRVQLDGRWDTVSMRAMDEGWFEAVHAGAGPGTRYCFRLPDDVDVPDPASRWQPLDVHGPSQVVDARGYAWRSNDWRGRCWPDAVIYELHVGTFTSQGTFDGVCAKLDHLAALGVTALELMPVADFPGRWNWGYDGVLPYAPDATYGTPDDLRRLVDEAHLRGLMVLLDVVYNHFGPDGNYLHSYAPSFFTDRVRTPWGDAIDFSVPAVREYFIHNALYWLEEFRFDGLRLDAVHAIADHSSPNVLDELADRVRARFADERKVHLVLENDDNAAHHLARDEHGRPRRYTAQWNDDLHHALHVLATGERDGYYADYASRPADHLLRCLSEGFAWQGEVSEYRGARRRGEPSAHLPADAFVSFTQNHDQVGNRAFGERLAALAPEPARCAVAALVLLAPAPPLLFMGEEWGAVQPFLYFCDFPDELAAKVREGRAREFAAFERFGEGCAADAIPDPTADSAYEDSVLDWSRRLGAPHAQCLERYRQLLALRREWLAPRLRAGPCGSIAARRFAHAGLHVIWRLGDGSRLTLLANLHEDRADGPPDVPAAPVLYSTHARSPGSATALAPWEVCWWLEQPENAEQTP
jgi:maltooligosyltrehalose trehalohydrolase